MKDSFVESMVSYFETPNVKNRLEICSEWSIVEHWFRMEIYMWLRKRGWTVPLVEGPYYTRLPARPSKKKRWNERPKWCDMVAMGPDGVYWLELKAIWFRKRTWKNNLYSALRDFLSLAAMDIGETEKLWEKPTGDASSYGEFLRLHHSEIRKRTHHRYSVCLLQALPEHLLDGEFDNEINKASSEYLERKAKEVANADLARFAWESEDDRKSAVASCRRASTVTPGPFDIGITDRGARFPEKNPKGALVLAVWKVPEAQAP